MGRTTERQELDDLLDAAHGGHSGRLLLTGDPGIGISTMLDWFGSRARERGFDVSTHRGVDMHGPFPVPACDAPGAVLIIDDLEHAAGAAPARLAALLDRTSAPTVLVGAVHTSVGDLPAVDGWLRRDIPPLSLDDSVHLLTRTFGDSLDPGVCLALFGELGGNPLALLEVSAALTAAQRGGRAPLPDPLPVPHRLTQAWGGVLGRLADPALAAAVDVLVCGDNPPLLMAMSGPGRWLEDDVLTLLDAELIDQSPDGTLTFRTPVIGAVIRAQTAPSVLRDRHRAAAALGTEVGAPPGEIVHHLSRATTLPDEVVAALVQQQAERASALDQLLVANDAWQCAARLSTCAATRTERALRALQLIIENGLDYAGAHDLLTLLSGQELDAEQALWVEWLESLVRADADPEAALATHWSTIQHARVTAPHTLHELLIDMAMNAWTLGDAAAGLTAARDYVALHLAGDADIVEPPWTGTALLAAGLVQSGDIADGMTMRARAIAAAAAVDPRTMSFDRLLTTVFLDDLLLDDSPPAGERLLLAAQRAQAHSSGLACIFGIRAWRYRATGHWDLAHDMLRRGRPIAAALHATGPQVGMAALTCELAALQGQDDVLTREGIHARAFAVRTGDRRRLATIDRAFGMKALAAGRLEEAQVNLRAAADVAFLGRGLRDAVIPSRVDLVEVHLRLDDRTEAGRRAGEISEILRQMDEPLARALDLRVRGLVRDDQDLLRVAVEAHQEARDPFEEARTRLLLAERLRRDRQRVLARTHLLAAERLFDLLEATPWLERARTELRATGTERARTSGLESLTPQEAAVAGAVAAGRSNREVAAELFISVRTVEYHLASVYRKLGVRGRTALAGALAVTELPDAG